MAMAGCYEVAVRKTAIAVIKPLKKSICSLNSVYEALIVADVNPVTGYCSNYGYIRKQIEQACWSLQCSDQAASTCLTSLDESLATLTQDEGKLERRKCRTKETLDNLRTQQDSNKMMLKESQGALNQAESNVRSAKRTLERQKKRLEDFKGGLKSGLVVFSIAVVDLFAGGQICRSILKAISEASDAIEIAEEELEKFQNQADKYESKVSKYKSEISETNVLIEVIDYKLGNIRRDVEMIKRQKSFVGELQSKVRNAVHLLSVLSGRVNVMERQTRQFILHEPVVMVMEEILRLTEEIVGNELLGRSGVLSLIDRMRVNNKRLRAVCASQNTDNDMMQYF